MRSATGITRIFNGDLIDGTGSAPVRDAVVVVDGDRISYAGRRSVRRHSPTM